MQMARKRHAELLRDVVASYVDGISVPKLDESEIAAHRARLDAYTPSRRLMTTVGLATAAILALFLAVDASAVVAGMQRVFAAFMLVGGRTVPMSVREVDLTTARADVPVRNHRTAIASWNGDDASRDTFHRVARKRQRRLRSPYEQNDARCCDRRESRWRRPALHVSLGARTRSWRCRGRAASHVTKNHRRPRCEGLVNR